MNAKYSKHLSPDEGSNSAESDYKTQPLDISSSPQVLLTPPYTSLPEDRSVFFILLILFLTKFYFRDELCDDTGDCAKAPNSEGDGTPDSDDKDGTGALDDEHKAALNHLQLGLIFSEYELMQKFKEMAQKSPKDLQSLSKSMFILLKRKLGSLSDKDLCPGHEKVYRTMIRDAVYCEDQNQVQLRLCEFDSLTHHKFYQSIQKVFKMKGPREIKTEFNLTITDIKFPYSRNKQGFPPVEISGQSKSKTLFEISVSGLSAMIFVSFFLKPILNNFIKNTCSGETKHLKEQKDSEDNAKEERTGSPKMNTTQSNNVTIQDVSDNDSNDGPKPEIEKVEEYFYNRLEKGKDEKRKAEYENKTVLEDKKEEAAQCYYCALLHVAESIETLLDESFHVDLSCVHKCKSDCLELIVRALCRLVVSKEINSVMMECMLKNIEIVVKSVLDKTSYLRAQFYCVLFEMLGDVDITKQPIIVTLSRELCELLTESNPSSISDTMKESKQARRNIIQFMRNSGHFFSLQALVESWNIMYKKGIDIQCFLTRNMRPIIQMFESTPETSFSEYFFCMTKITRELATSILRQENILIIEAEEIEFRHEDNNIKKEGDMYIYVNKKDEVIYQMHMQDQSVTVEKIEFFKLEYSSDKNILSSKDWHFFLPSQVSQDVSILFKETNSTKNRQSTDKSGMDKTIESESKYYSTVLESGIPMFSRSEESNQFNPVNRISPVECTFKGGVVQEEEQSKYSSPHLKRKHQGNSADSDQDNDDDEIHLEEEATIETNLVIPRDKVMKYWNSKTRNFVRHLVAEEWPRNYGSPCAVIFSYCNTKKYNSAKRLNHFCRMVGSCKICKAKHTCMILSSPFEESVDEEGVIRYTTKDDLMIDVTVTGHFEKDEDNIPNIRKPLHDMKKATGLFLKGKKRERIGEKVSREGVQNVFMEQFENVDDHQMKYGNKTTARSYDVLMTARQEFERKQHCGNDFHESIQNVFESQKTDVSLNFEETVSSKQLPGFIRSVQQTPLKVVMGNYDQLRIGANYLNKSEKSIVFMDSSGKFLKNEKGKPKLLNTAVVIPPPAAGHAPFPIFEMISERNKTIDFQTFLEYGWSYLSNSINNEKVDSPKVAVSDFSFPNIHALLAVFNRVKIDEYLETLYTCSIHGKKSPYATVLTICENHTLPNLLLYARNFHSDKMVADSVVAGFLKVFEAETLDRAIQVFENLARVHCLKGISKEARENIKEMVFPDPDETLCDYVGNFGNDASEEENTRFGSRGGLRENSRYYRLFKGIIDKIIETDQDTEKSNRFYAPKLMLAMTKQYLSLFPLFSASFLPDKKVTTNSYIELYWKDQRRILKDIPMRQRLVIR